MTLIGGMWVNARVTDSEERAQPTSGLAFARAASSLAVQLLKFWSCTVI